MKESQKNWVKKQEQRRLLCEIVKADEKSGLYFEDTIVGKVVKDFRERSEGGIKKYNTTLKENNTDNFFKHLREELMDGILYLTKIEDIIKTTPNDKELGEKLRRMCK